MKSFLTLRPEIAALQRRLLRQIRPARKMAMLGQMNQTVKVLALSGLQFRYPTESPENASPPSGRPGSRAGFGPLGIQPNH